MIQPQHAEEYTEALGLVFAGAVRLADVAADIGIPEALGLTPEEWAQRRLAGQVRLTIAERRQVVAANPDKSTRELAGELGVSHETVAADRRQESDTDTNGSDPFRQESDNHVMRVMGSSESVEWETPQPLFDTLNAEFGFEVDVCASPGLEKCPRYYSPEENGLAQDWRGICWMNPPYGDEIPRWVAKAHEAGTGGATVVCLVPARVDTGWWWDYCRHAEIRFLRGRLHFGNGDTAAPFPSAVVVFGRPARVIWWER